MAYGTTVIGGGIQNVGLYGRGGGASGTTVNGGNQVVFAGGQAYSTAVNNGTATLSGGTAVGLTISQGSTRLRPIQRLTND